MSLSCCFSLPKWLLSAEGQTKARSLDGICGPGLPLARFSSLKVGCLVQEGLPGGSNSRWRKTSTSQGRLMPPPGVSFCDVLGTAGRAWGVSHLAQVLLGARGGWALSLQLSVGARPAACVLCPGDMGAPMAALPPSGAPCEHPLSPAGQRSIPPLPLA